MITAAPAGRRICSPTGNVYHLARILAAGAYNGLILGVSIADAKAFADRAAELLHELHDPRSRALLLANIGVVAVLPGDTDTPKPRFANSSQLGRDHLTARYAHDGLEGLAADYVFVTCALCPRLSSVWCVRAAETMLPLRS